MCSCFLDTRTAHYLPNAFGSVGSGLMKYLVSILVPTLTTSVLPVVWKSSRLDQLSYDLTSIEIRHRHPVLSWRAQTSPQMKPVACVKSPLLHVMWTLGPNRDATKRRNLREQVPKGSTCTGNIIQNVKPGYQSSQSINSSSSSSTILSRRSCTSLSSAMPLKSYSCTDSSMRVLSASGFSILVISSSL